MEKFDYIIAGAGCAGLSLLARMIRSGQFNRKKILLIDQAEKTVNDRTWCFWEKEEGFFESVVCKTWDKLWIHTDDYTELKAIPPYRYKMIRGIDFYNYCLDLIKPASNITLAYGKIEKIHSDAKETYIIANGQRIEANYIFNSIIFEKPILGRKDFYLLQHFTGWLIETETHRFNPSEATLMDFRVCQKKGTAFVYLLPISEKAALVEYTLFTETLLEKQEYAQRLSDYVKGFLGIDNYSIRESEFGVIPMTSHAFQTRKQNIIHIGTAGGQTKASTGYTFQFIQKQSDEIMKQCINGCQPCPQGPKSRFNYYDRLFLDVLTRETRHARKIFARLFGQNKIADIFPFLDSESSLMQEFRIIRSLPPIPFIKAAIRHILPG